jgi:hypothetical protein
VKNDLNEACHVLDVEKDASRQDIERYMRVSYTAVAMYAHALIYLLL